MTAIKFVPIPLDVATDALVVFQYLQANSNSERDKIVAGRLAIKVGEAISIAGEHVSTAELLCAELLELIGRVSGRALSTIPGDGSLAAAEEALSEMAPVLGKVLHLPRAANTDAGALDAAVARGLADMPGPTSVQPFEVTAKGHVALPARDRWVVPRKGERWGGRLVLEVDHGDGEGQSICLFLQENPPEGEPF
jgi:hypothetical protein